MPADVYEDLGVRVGANEVRRGRRVVPAENLGASWIEHESISSLPVVLAIGGLAIAVQGSAVKLVTGALLFVACAVWLWLQLERSILCVEVQGRAWELATSRDDGRLDRLQQQLDLIRPRPAPVVPDTRQNRIHRSHRHCQET